MTIDTLRIVRTNYIHVTVIIYPQLADNNIVNGCGNLLANKTTVQSVYSLGWTWTRDIWIQKQTFRQP